jgi:hypothetical protein
MTAMQLSPTSPIVQMGWDAELSPWRGAKVDCTECSQSGREELGARASQNRMVSTETAGNTRIDNRYDPLHRRVLKIVSTWDTATSAWVSQRSTRFTYDGCAELRGEQRVRLHEVQPGRVRRAWGASKSNMQEEEETTPTGTRRVTKSLARLQ